MSNKKQKGINYTERDFYEFGKQKLTQAAIARQYGVGDTAVSYQFKKKHLRRAYDAGANGEAFPGKTEKAKTENPENTLSSAEILETDLPEDIPYEEIEAKILEAIESRYCFPTQIKRFTGFDFNLSGILSGMEMDGKIFQKEQGVMVAYFINGWQVKRFWNEGGKVAIEFEDGSKKSNGVIYETPKTPVEKAVEIKTNLLINERVGKIQLESAEKKIIVEPRFENTLAHIEKNGHSKDSIKQVKKNLAGDEPEIKSAVAEPGKQSRTVVNLAGGKVVAGFEGNLFELTPDERGKLNKLIDLIQEF